MSNRNKKPHQRLRSFSWSNNATKTKEQLLIENTLVEWHEAKHPVLSNFEIDLLNSVSLKSCPFCGSNKFIKYGSSQEEFKDTNASHANDDLHQSLTPFSIQRKFQYLSRLNILFTFSNSTRFIRLHLIIETLILPDVICF